MLADSPTHYLEEEECMDFLSGVPTTWDETIALDGKVGEYVVMARRSGNRWYLGAMTNWQERWIDVDLSFLKGSDFKMTIWEDGPNAHRNAEDFRVVETFGQTRSGKMRFHLAPGGGMVAVIVIQ
jgi:alpha-glucosidase